MEMKGIKIVVAEDMEGPRRMICAGLEKAGFTVMGAADGDKALGYFNRHFDIRGLVTDIEMPGMNGLELVEAVKSSPFYKRKDLAIFIMSTHAFKSQVHSHLSKYGVTPDRILMKPVMPDKLTAMVKSATSG